MPLSSLRLFDAGGFSAFRRTVAFTKKLLYAVLLLEIHPVLSASQCSFIMYLIQHHGILLFCLNYEGV